MSETCQEPSTLKLHIFSARYKVASSPRSNPHFFVASLFCLASIRTFSTLVLHVLPSIQVAIALGGDVIYFELDHMGQLLETEKKEVRTASHS
jgi:hypothetical protein